jgi:hypothetical protein
LAREALVAGGFHEAIVDDEVDARKGARRRERLRESAARFAQPLALARADQEHELATGSIGETSDRIDLDAILRRRRQQRQQVGFHAHARQHVENERREQDRESDQRE